MKKYSILLAVVALVFSSLACKTVMGAGNSGTQNPSDGSGAATVPPASTDGGNINVGGDSPFPVASDATNVVSTPQAVTYQTKMSADDIMKFYRDELTKQGYSEDTTLTTNFAGVVAMIFKGNGKTIAIAAAPTGGSLSVTAAYQQ